MKDGQVSMSREQVCALIQKIMQVDLKCANVKQVVDYKCEGPCNISVLQTGDVWGSIWNFSSAFELGHIAREQYNVDIPNVMIIE